MGVSLTQAERILEEKGFEIEIQDSVFVDTAAPLSVLRQFPEAEVYSTRSGQNAARVAGETTP